MTPRALEMLLSFAVLLCAPLAWLAAGCRAEAPPAGLDPSRALDLTPSLRGSPLARSSAVIDNTLMPAALLPPPAARSVVVDVPADDPVLRFSYGSTAAGEGCEGAARVELLVRPPGEPGAGHGVFEDSIDISRPRWKHASVSLSAWRGEPVELLFRTGAGAGDEGSCPLPPVAIADVILDGAIPDVGAGEQRPNIVVILVDTLRADQLGYMGSDLVHTPAIDALAAESLRFTQAFSVSPWTRESVFSMATASYFSSGEIRLRGLREFPLPGGVPTLAQRLAEQGYRCEALVANPYLGLNSGFEAGFQRYRMEDRDERFPDQVAELLGSKGPRQPRFLYLHLMAPHMPLTFHPEYTPGQLEAAGLPEPWARLPGDRNELLDNPPSAAIQAAMRASYRAEIEWTDHIVGALVELVDQRLAGRPTWLVFMSDHGEEHWDHGGFEHGHTLYEELLHVPLLVRPPEGSPLRGGGATEPRRVTLVDLGLTLLDLAGIPRGVQPVGISLRPLLEGRSLALPPRRTTLSYGLLYDQPRQAIGRGGIEHTRVFAGPPRTFTRDLGAEPPQQLLPPHDPRAITPEDFGAEWEFFGRLALTGTVPLRVALRAAPGDPVGLCVCHPGSTRLAELLPADQPVLVRSEPGEPGRPCRSFALPDGGEAELRLELSGVAEGLAPPSAWVFDARGRVAAERVQWPAGAEHQDGETRLVLPWAVFEPQPWSAAAPEGAVARLDWHVGRAARADDPVDLDAQQEKLRVLGYLPSD